MDQSTTMSPATFSDLCNVGREQILLGFITHNSKCNNSFFNPTGFDDFFFKPLNTPFFNHIYFLNFFVYTTESTISPIINSKIDPLVISFYMPKTKLPTLQTFCTTKNYLLELNNNSTELKLIHINDTYDDDHAEIKHDFSHLSEEVQHVTVTETDHTRKNLYFNLFQHFYDTTDQTENTKLAKINEELKTTEWMFESFFDPYISHVLKRNKHLRAYYKVMQAFDNLVDKGIEVLEERIINIETCNEVISLGFETKNDRSEDMINMFCESCESRGFRVVKRRRACNMDRYVISVHNDKQNATPLGKTFYKTIHDICSCNLKWRKSKGGFV